MCQSPVGSVAIQPSLQGSTIQDEFAPLGYEDLPPPVGRPHILDFSHSSSLFLCLSAICRALAHMVQQCALQRHGYRNVLAAQRTSARSVALLESTPQGEARGLRHPQNFNHGERHARSTGLLVVLLFARTRSTCSTGASAALQGVAAIGILEAGSAEQALLLATEQPDDVRVALANSAELRLFRLANHVPQQGADQLQALRHLLSRPLRGTQ
mmetsp:Transcript_71208/g.204221  ORF Transcript_71208/g.204221 Transcript_71208/m.204221 type:complete len:213 (-) Transcript_71208:14-652(-)